MDTATRRRGVFLTPLVFAEKACQHLEAMLGNHWWQSGDYRLWDMAAGTGHLEHFLPKEFLPNCHLSTLEEQDVQHLKKEFPAATVFQYDYLNDDVETANCRRQTATDASGVEAPLLLSAVCRLPSILRQDLANPKIKWIILVNPPYATAQEAGLKGTSKEGVADTKIRKQMHAEGLGEVSRELYVQFLYRIMLEFQHRETILGLFSPIKYLVSTNYQKFRDNVFSAQFLSGFTFSSENFGGTSKASHFPVAFILWNISALDSHKGTKDTKKSLCPLCLCEKKKEAIHLDILDNTAEKIGVKTLKSANRNDFLSRWIKRPPGTNIFPPFGSALTIKSDNVDTRNRIADHFLASLMCPGNELQNQQQTAFLSGPQASAGALSVTPENFEQAVVVFAARRIPKDTWINHVDQLLRPNRELSPEFIADCAVWSLFDSKNQTVALRDVVYQDRVYQVANHFFPFPAAEMFSLCPLCLCEKKIISHKGTKDTKDSTNVAFVADWLSQQELSTEAQNVMRSAKAVYQFYYENLHLLQREKFKIATYDAGWHQIRQALLDATLGEDLLAELKRRHDRLKEKILPLLVDYGIVS